MQRFFVLARFMCVFLVGVMLLGCPGNNEGAQKPEADFVVDMDSGEAPFAVQFTDMSLPGDSPLQSWQWDFGDGTGDTRPNPAKTYEVRAGEAESTFTVRLTVASAQGEDTLIREAFINVIAPVIGDVGAIDVAVTPPLGAEANTAVISVTVADNPEEIPALEGMTLLSSVYKITHDGNVADFTSPGEEDTVGNTILEIPLEDTVATGMELDSEIVHILAILDDGSTVPLQVTINEGSVSTQVTGLPQSASYAVIYRSESYDLYVGYYGGLTGPSATTDLWNQWRVNVSDSVMRQLTALRMGSIVDPSDYDATDFSEAELATTEAFLLSEVRDIRDGIVDAGMRSPALASTDGAYHLSFFNIRSAYTRNYSDFNDIIYSNNEFGQIVIDPMQLLSISAHNAAAAEDGAGTPDIGQEFTFRSAFAEAVIEAGVDAYDFPEIAGVSPSDINAMGTPQALSVFAGVEQGLVAYVSQWAEGLRLSRGFESNEYALLSQPLFFPYLEGTPSYAVSGQEFFTYLQRSLASGAPLQHILTESSSGLLISLENKLASELGYRAGLPNPPEVTFDQALHLTYQALDEGLALRWSSSLASEYWKYVYGRAMDHDAATQLRISDAEDVAGALAEEVFGEGALVRRVIAGAVDKVNVSADIYDEFADVPPMAARGIVFEVTGAASEVTLTFNSADWTQDGLQYNVGIAVYRDGAIVTHSLAFGEDTLTLTDLPGNRNAKPVEIVVVAANLDYTETNSISVLAETSTPAANFLEEYVHHTGLDDFDYAFDLSAETRTSSSVGHFLDMSSGAWHDGSALTYLEEGQWQHNLIIDEPAVPTSTTAFLFITSGMVEDAEDAFIIALGQNTQTVTVVMDNMASYDGLSIVDAEDELIAASFQQYLISEGIGTADSTWPVLLPMARGIVRAMDTVQEYLTANSNRHVVVDNFVLYGQGNQAWAAWLAAAADTRVKGVISLDFEGFNLTKQFGAHYDAYGTYDIALKPFTDLIIFSGYSSGSLRSLYDLIDPLSYKENLDMPKYVARGTGTPIWLPDAHRYYWSELSGEKYLNYSANVGLVIEEGDGEEEGEDPQNLAQSVVSFYRTIVTDQIDRPAFSYEFEADNRVVVQTEMEPTYVRLWQADNELLRDFRQAGENVDSSIPVNTDAPGWRFVELVSDSNRFVAEVQVPETGWRGFFVEVSFAGFGPWFSQDFTEFANTWWMNGILSTDYEDMPFVCSTPLQVLPKD
jgi:PhoPQ-activated pathogenicity-related protein/PKD repeat protein